jgi:hypothetical protein
MVGRALRGPKFGGTDNAFIVSFIDNWKHRIKWAEYDQLAPGLADETIPEYGKRPPIQLISIDLVRRLARQMDSGINVNPAPYKAFLPIGWYRVEYYAKVDGTDDVEPVGQLVMVFEDERSSFERFIRALESEDLGLFEEDSVRLADVKVQIDRWCKRFFSDVGQRAGGGLTEDLFTIARHMGQNEKQTPKFFPFEVRDAHDLDAVAQSHLDRALDDRAKAAALKAEYARRDRYWQVIYYTYPLFKSHYDACINRILDADDNGNDPRNHPHTNYIKPEPTPLAEPSEDLKEQVKSRDGYQCLCCGYHKKRTQLQVDHILPRYHGGDNHFDNLQTLCKACNGPDGKGTGKINFRSNQTMLTTAPSLLPIVKTPVGVHAKAPEWWEMFLRRTINLFFQCSAVDSVEIGGKGERFRHWRIRLFTGNPSEWLVPHLPTLVQRIRLAREEAGYGAAPETISVTGSDSHSPS